MRWTETRIVAFDTETTGLSAFDGDRVIEFGAVEIAVGTDGRVTRVVPHQMFVNPEMPIPRSATKVSNITDDQVASAPVFAKVADRVDAILSGAVVVAHNLWFDVNFLRVELGRCGRGWPRTAAEVDTLALSQRLLPHLKSHKLGDVAAELGVPHATAHRATDDSEACGRVLVELARRHGAPRELEAFIEWADAANPPPDTGHLVVGQRGLPEFCFGPHQGKLVDEAPDYLQWMLLAVERRDGRWQPRFPDSLRQWVARWLRVRCSGRTRSGTRSQGPLDWNIDPPTWVRQGRGA